jgi:hypothetical protein
MTHDPPPICNPALLPVLDALMLPHPREPPSRTPAKAFERNNDTA